MDNFLNSQKPVKCKCTVETSHLQQSATKKSSAFQLKMYLFLLKFFPLLRDGVKLISSTQTRPDPWLPFIIRQPSTAMYQRHFILLSPCQSHRYKLVVFPFPGHCHHRLRDGPSKGKVWSRALNVRIYIAALGTGGQFPSLSVFTTKFSVTIPAHSVVIFL